jgi:hypothetical protein
MSSDRPRLNPAAATFARAKDIARQTFSKKFKKKVNVQ